MTTTGRRGRLFRREDEGEDDAADLSEDEHAWWAAREEVAGVPHGTAPEPEPEPEAGSGFSDYWSAESLFEEQARPKPPPKDQAGSAHASVDVPGAMDLDSAHLVLQVKIGVDWEDITSAHRKLAKLYHPDRLISYSPEAQELGRTRMAEINAAHATLRALHFH
jgi:DnaJ-domain-containing protein 1